MAQQQKLFDKVEKIDPISEKDAVNPVTGLAEPETRVAPNKEQFDSLMGNQGEIEAVAGRKVESGQVSLMDEISNMGRRVDQVGRASPQQLVAQAQEVVGKIEELKAKLNTPNLEIKSSVQQTMQTKLNHIDDSLKVALSKAGVEYKAPEVAAKSDNPIDRFLGFLTDGQDKLASLTTDISSMTKSGKAISPGAMLMIQIKVGFIQQELELFTSLLNKSLESTKTIMNIQV